MRTLIPINGIRYKITCLGKNNNDRTPFIEYHVTVTGFSITHGEILDSAIDKEAQRMMDKSCDEAHREFLHMQEASRIASENVILR